MLAVWKPEPNWRCGPCVQYWRHPAPCWAAHLGRWFHTVHVHYTIHNTAPDIENSGKTFKRIINHTHIVKLILYLILDQRTICNFRNLNKGAISKKVSSWHWSVESCSWCFCCWPLCSVVRDAETWVAVFRAEIAEQIVAASLHHTRVKHTNHCCLNRHL